MRWDCGVYATGEGGTGATERLLAVRVGGTVWEVHDGWCVDWCGGNTYVRLLE